MLCNATNFQLPYKLLGVITLYFAFTSLIYASENAPKQLDIRPHEAADTCNTDIAQVRVTVNNVGFGGILSVELYHDPKNFLNKKGRTRRIRIPATETTLSYALMWIPTH